MENNTLTITKIIDAPVEKVFKAWTEKSEIEKWYGPEGMTTEVDKLEVKVGGEYRFIMNAPSGKHIVGGVFKEINPPGRISFSWHWEGSPEDEVTLVMIDLKAKDAHTTELTLTQSGFKKMTGKEQSLESHRMGWSSSFNKLAKI